MKVETRHTDTLITNAIFERYMKRLPTDEEIEKIRQRFSEKMSEEIAKNPSVCSEISGAVKMLNLLKESNKYEFGFATGSWSSSAKLKLEAAGIDYSGRALSSSDNLAHRKDIVLDSIAKSNLKTGKVFEKVIYCGDGTWDYLTAKDINIPFIGIDYHSNGKLARLGATKIINDYKDTQKFFELLESY
jgi:phosphoglycolate phosphatase-like HAD superfamily hydrolase